MLGLPYGMLADRIGRKPVLMLVLLGGNLADGCVKLISELNSLTNTLSIPDMDTVAWFPSVLPLRLVWASSSLQIIGGGSQVGASMFFVFATDIYAPADR